MTGIPMPLLMNIPTFWLFYAFCLS